MAIVIPLLKKDYQSKDGANPVYVRVQYERTRRYIPVGHKVLETQSNGKVFSHPKAAIISSKIATIVKQTETYRADCELHNRPVRLNTIGTEKTSNSFTQYLNHRAKQFGENDQIIMQWKLKRMAKELQSALGSDVYFEDLAADALRKYETYLIQGILKENFDDYDN